MTVTADHELFAALQADVVTETRSEVTNLQAEVARLRDALRDCMLARARYTRVADGRWERDDTSFEALFGFLSPMTAEEVVAHLAEHGVQMAVVPGKASS